MYKGRDGRRLHLVGSRAAKKLNHGQRSAPVHTRGKTKQGGMAIGQAALFFCSFSPAEYFVTQSIMIAHRLSF